MNKLRLNPTPAWLDQERFEAVFHEHYSQIFGVIFRLVGDPDAADDLTAEAFWRLWQNPPAKNENLGGWLYRVALRLGYNHLRASHRRSRYQIQANQEANLTGSAAEDPEEEAEFRQARERVRAIFQQLPFRDVQMLVLRYSGLSYKEIAAALEINDASVGKLLARAEARFEERYRRDEDDTSR